MKKLGLLAVIAVASTVGVNSTAAHAGPCDAGSSLATGRWSIGTGDAGTIYIDDRDYMENGLWIYLESNGIHDLQRGGTAPVDPIGLATGSPDTDPCTDASPAGPDMLIF